ncbi:MAG: sialidase family protein [Verrucomicrobia bacterium]|nr:sialidase family protein [Verrucomicrobiota bacterium]MDA1066184.1 sialidase family protein [Verrucomicrobiota bacterium]
MLRLFRNIRQNLINQGKTFKYLQYAVVLSAVLSSFMIQSAVLHGMEPTSEPFVAPKGEYVTEQDRYHTFRIPGMVVAQNGTILLFAEGRRGDGSDPRKDENSPIDLVMRRSTDNGDTWEPIAVIESGYRPDGKLVDFADPTPVLDAKTGTVFLLYGQWPDLAPTTVAYGQDPDSAEGNQVVWVRSSTDDGKTWSDRHQIVYPDEPHETSDGLFWRQAEPGPGSGIQLRWQKDASLNGRLVIPAKRSGSKTPDGEVTVEPFVYYSDDHGKTWQVGHVTSGPDANEDEVVELTDGTVFLDGRQNSGYLRRRHPSYDGGITWGPDIPDTIPLTPVDGSMIRYSAKRDGHDQDRILFSCALGEKGLNRNNIAIWISYNEGKSFTNPVQLNSGFAAYSVMQRLKDGTIGVAVETAKDEGVRYGEITFYRIDLAQLERKTESH